MYQVGIIGFGKIGKLRAKLVNAHPKLRLDAVCETNPVQLEMLPACHIFSDYCELLSKRKPDIVFVCTSNQILAQAVCDALDVGCHVFSEKPPGRNIAETQQMMAAEKRNPNLKLKFGFNHRYHDSVIESLKLVKSGRLGDILSVRGVYGKSGAIDFESEWRSSRDLAGGGILLDQGIHMLDLMLLYCNDFTDVKSFVDTLFWDIDVEDNAFAIMRNKKRQIGMLLSSATQWKHTFNLEVILQDGYLKLAGILSVTMSYGRESLIIARKTYEQGRIGNPYEETYYFDQDFSWEREIEEFVYCVSNDKPVQVGSSQDALKVMTLVYRIYQSDTNWWAQINKKA